MLNTGTGHGEIHLIGFHGKSEAPTAEQNKIKETSVKLTLPVLGRFAFCLPLTFFVT